MLDRKHEIVSYFQVSEEVMGELRGGERQPLIVQEQPRANNSMVEVDSRVINAFLGTKYYNIFNIENKMKKDKKKKDKKKKDKKKKDKKDKDETEAYSILKAEHDIENDHGWSVSVTNEHLIVFKEYDFALFMVNLTRVSCSKLVLGHKILFPFICFKFS